MLTKEKDGQMAVNIGATIRTTTVCQSTKRARTELVGGADAKQSSLLQKRSLLNQEENDDDKLNDKSIPWDEYYYQLAYFKAINGHTNVPVDYICEDDVNINLNQWIIQERAKLQSACFEAKMKKQKLSPDIQQSIEKLSDIGFELNLSSSSSWPGNSNDDDEQQQATADPVDDEEADEEASFGHCPQETRQRRRPSKQRYQRREWEEYYKLLLAYKNEYNHLRIPENYKTPQDSINLGKWLANQRHLYRAYHNSGDKPITKGGPTLTAERIQALNDIGIVWNPRKEKNKNSNKKPMVSFETRLEQMRQYRQEHGNLRVSKRHDESGLAWWLQEQRQRQHSMSRERFAQLEAAGMEWDNTTARIMDKKRGSTATAMQNDNNSNNKAATSRTKPRATKAEQDSVIWDMPKRQLWQARFEELVEYKRVHGAACVPVKSSALGKWLANQRHFLKKRIDMNGNDITDTITRELIERLIAIDAWTKRTKPLEWDDYYKLLVEYKEENRGHFPPTRFITTDGIKLGQFVSITRQKFKPYVLVDNNMEDDDGASSSKQQDITKEEETIMKKRIEMLNKIDFPWSAPKGRPSLLTTTSCLNDGDHDDDDDDDDCHHTRKRAKKSSYLKWEYYYNCLVEYKKANNGHFPPTCFVTANGIKLGRFVSRTRHTLKPYVVGSSSKQGVTKEEETILRKRINMLNKINFPWSAQKGKNAVTAKASGLNDHGDYDDDDHNCHHGEEEEQQSTESDNDI